MSDIACDGQGRRKQSLDGEARLDVDSKLLIIHVHEAHGKILDLASYLAVRRRSHCTQLQTGSYRYFVFLPCKDPQV